MKRIVILFCMTLIPAAFTPAQDNPVGKVARVNGSEVLISSPRAAEIFTLGSSVILKSRDGSDITLKIYFPMMSIAKCSVEKSSLKYADEIREGMPVFIPGGKSRKPGKEAAAAGNETSVKLSKTSFNLVSVAGKKFKSGIEDYEDAEVGRSFLIGETEVTYAVWTEVYDWAVKSGYSFENKGEMGSGGGEGRTNQHPVTMISWRDAIVWCNALTEYSNQKLKTRLDPVYYEDQAHKKPIRSSEGSLLLDLVNIKNGSCDNPFVKSDASGFRLPINSEWELAARYIADTDSNGILTGKDELLPGNYASGASGYYLLTEALNEVAVFAGNSNSSTAPVKSKKPNRLGIYDMSGNVSEWCFEWSNGSGRTVRGGSWVNFSDDLQAGNPGDSISPTGTNTALGFRVARTAGK
jgi:formylglycine-generating enzyme required for sulfatase activity